jgi:hypothetical protein
VSVLVFNEGFYAVTLNCLVSMYKFANLQVRARPSWAGVHAWMDLAAIGPECGAAMGVGSSRNSFGVGHERCNLCTHAMAAYLMAADLTPPTPPKTTGCRTSLSPPPAPAASRAASSCGCRVTTRRTS